MHAAFSAPRDTSVNIAASRLPARRLLMHIILHVVLRYADYLNMPFCYACVYWTAEMDWLSRGRCVAYRNYWALRHAPLKHPPGFQKHCYLAGKGGISAGSAL